MIDGQKKLLKSRIVVWNSPRAGGPLRWSKDLATYINASGHYTARLITNPIALMTGMLNPQADLVHAAVPAVYRLWRKPYVLTVKGDYTIEKDFWKLLYPKAIQRADVVTVPSQYLIDRIPDLTRAVVIPNAVDLNQFTVDRQPDPDSVKLLIVTNFWFPEKARGIEELLGLIAKAIPKNLAPKVQITVLGDGAYIERVKAKAKQMHHQVVFPGWADPRFYFPNANIFLYYSYHDNMPNALLEAMAAGLPVITNNVGAIPEMIEHGQSGLIAQTFEEYSHLLNRLISDQALQQVLGRGARARVEEGFTWEKVIRNYLEIYRSLLGS